MRTFYVLVGLVLAGCGDGAQIVEPSEGPFVEPSECWAFTVQGTLLETLGGGEFRCRATTRRNGAQWESVQCLVPENSSLIWLGQTCDVEVASQVWDPRESRLLLDGTLWAEGLFLPLGELPFWLDLAIDQAGGRMEGGGQAEFAAFPIELDVVGGFAADGPCPAFRYPADNPCDARD